MSIYYKPGEYQSETELTIKRDNYLRIGGLFLISAIVSLGAVVVGYLGGASPENILAFGAISSAANAGIGLRARQEFNKARHGLEVLSRNRGQRHL